MTSELVFLGGTCNNTTWRENLIKKFKPKVNFFNPVVPDWTPELKVVEDEQKERSTIGLYCITPEIKGVYSIAEVVYDSFVKKTLFCILDLEKFEAFQQKSLKAVSELLAKNGVVTVYTIEDLATQINKLF